MKKPIVTGSARQEILEGSGMTYVETIGDVLATAGQHLATLHASNLERKAGEGRGFRQHSTQNVHGGPLQGRQIRVTVEVTEFGGKFDE